MGKASEQNDKLDRAVIVSVVLHIVLIALLIWGSLTQKTEMGGGGAGGEVIDAVMVDPGAVTEQYNRQQQQETDAKRAEQQRQKKADQQAEELQKKQATEQQRLKELERERLQAQENAKQAAEEQKKQAAEQQKAAAAAIAKAKEEQKQAEAAAVQAKAEADKMMKAQAETKKKAEAEAKKAAAAAAAKKAAAAEAKKKAAAEAVATTDVEDLFGGLANAKNAPKSGSGVGAAAAGKGGGKKSGASAGDINGYLGQVTAAIQSKFYDANLYKGRTCNLRIKLAPDGLLIDIKAEGGDPALCQAAIAAAKLAKIPKPPSQDVYEVFKNVPLDFKPQ